MAKSAQSFYNEYNGKMGEDIDKSAGIQCVDGWKIFLRWCGFSNYNEMGYAPDGWAQSIWTMPNAQVLANFKRITDKNQFQNGDWVVWSKNENCFPLSHIGMYWEGKVFGLNQDSKNWNLHYSKNVFNYALGAYRWNRWSDYWDKKKYCCSGKYVRGQKYIDGYWYYFDDVTYDYITGFKYIENQNKIVYYDDKGRMVHGQSKINGYWYYFDLETGAMKTGIQLLSSKVNKEGYKVCLYDEKGRMVHGVKTFRNLTIKTDLNDGSIIDTKFESEEKKDVKS